METRKPLSRTAKRIIAGLVCCIVLMGTATWWSLRLNAQEQQLLGVWEQDLGEDGFMYTEFAADRKLLSMWTNDQNEVGRSKWKVRNGQLVLNYGAPDLETQLLYLWNGVSNEECFPIMELTPQRLVLQLDTDTDGNPSKLVLTRSTRASLRAQTSAN